MIPEDFDVIVFGSTPGGIATAVHAGRAGLRTALVSTKQHIGGLMASGLGGMDTLYDRPRAPIYDELLNRIRDYYRTTYGEGSAQYLACDRVRPGRFRYESFVAERVFEEMIAEIDCIAIHRQHVPNRVERAGSAIRAVWFDTPDGPVCLSATSYVDSSYEGDLAALAGVPHRIGREDRAEYGEPHAGRIFTVRRPGSHPKEAVAGLINLSPYPGTTQEIFADSTGAGDTAVQSYNFRLCLTDVPENRRLPEKPGNYDRETYVPIVLSDEETAGGNFALPSSLLMHDVKDLPLDPSRWSGQLQPNRKFSYNEGNIPGGAHRYPAGTPEERREIERTHIDHTLGLLYFLQNDDAVPDEIREGARQWGLARDEFPDNDNIPYEIYVREARRIVGRYVFTENDASIANGSRRTPVHSDTIAIAEWPMDSHECSTERQVGSLCEGEFLLVEKTRPSQVPFRSLLPVGVDNLLVPVCLSATHLGWGTIRVEPTWMHIGEAAGHAVVIARARGCAVADVPVDGLQRSLAEGRAILSFFNDVDASTKAPWYAAAQYFATKGFFAGYDVDGHEPITVAVADAWVRAVAELRSGTHDAARLALTVAKAEFVPDEGVTLRHLADSLSTAWRYAGLDEADLIGLGDSDDGGPEEPVSRGEVLAMLYQLVS